MRPRLLGALACPALAALVAALGGADAPALIAAGLLAGAAVLAPAGHRRDGRVVIGPLGRVRRERARPQVSVAAIARGGDAQVRGLAPAPAARPVRVIGAPRRQADPALLAASWDLATRHRARLADAAAAELGLADEPLPERAPHGPDPLLVAAIGAHAPRARRA